jgi:succinate dehydrogenase/fumarate reductase flavoprotein subunit
MEHDAIVIGGSFAGLSAALAIAPTPERDTPVQAAISQIRLSGSNGTSAFRPDLPTPRRGAQPRG